MTQSGRDKNSNINHITTLIMHNYKKTLLYYARQVPTMIIHIFHSMNSNHNSKVVIMNYLEIIIIGTTVDSTNYPYNSIKGKNNDGHVLDE